MSVSDTGRGETTAEGQDEGCVPLVTPTAFVFVRVVAAVVVVVALPAAGHAAVVLTSELVRLACPLGCTKHGQTLPDEKQENET